MGRPVADLYDHVRQHGPELVKFGIVGGLGTIIDLGGAAVLHSVYHVGPLESKALSITAATIFTYLGSRFWTFRHRVNQALLREGSLFVLLNLVGLVIAEMVIGLTTYGFGFKSALAYNAASVLGTGLGTIFRYFAYRRWVFLAAPTTATVPAIAVAEPQVYGPPWEILTEADYDAPRR
jgi:putative flippase GtrA